MATRRVRRWLVVTPPALAVLVGVGVAAVLTRSAGAAPADTRNAAGATVSPDDLDREQIDQLHAATLKATDSCFELKRLCATILVPAATLVSVFTDRRLNDAVFLAGMLVIVAFWLADSVSYFYQRRLRTAMTDIWVRRAARCAERYDHVPRPARVGPLGAAFNSSMIYYLILALLLGGAFLFFKTDLAGTAR